MENRTWELFLELFTSLPRQGPGNKESAEHALEFCKDLPSRPRIIDLGCGTGAQTLYLWELTKGSITAIDTYEKSIQTLQERIREHKLGLDIQALVGDMADLMNTPIGDEPYDLVWSEGAMYQITLPKALDLARNLLKPSGYLVFTDAVWLKNNPPKEIMNSFHEDYPEMGTIDTVLHHITQTGLTPIHHFALPDSAWWTDFYTPMEEQILEMRKTYHSDFQALNILNDLAREPELHRNYHEYYGYEYFIVQKLLE